MWENIKEFLSLNLRDYENIGINFNINLFILGLTAALCIASFITNYHRSIMVDMIKQLFRHNATSEDAAKTLSELGLAGSRGIKRALCGETQLRKMVSMLGEKKLSYEEYVALQKNKKKTAEAPNFDEARFYISESSLERAKRVYNSYDTSLLRTSLLCLLYFAVAVCIILASPEILTLINSALG